MRNLGALFLRFSRFSTFYLLHFYLLHFYLLHFYLLHFYLLHFYLLHFSARLAVWTDGTDFRRDL